MFNLNTGRGEVVVAVRFKDGFSIAINNIPNAFNIGEEFKVSRLADVVFLAYKLLKIDIRVFSREFVYINGRRVVIDNVIRSIRLKS